MRRFWCESAWRSVLHLIIVYVRLQTDDGLNSPYTHYVQNRQRFMLTHKNDDLGEFIMLQTIAIILIILWLLGLVSSYTMGGLIHILLVIAIVVVLLSVIQGRRL